MGDRIYSTGQIPASPRELRGLADDAERWRRDTYAGDIEARIIAALLSHHGWDYEPATPYVPPVKEGRKIVKRATPARSPGIVRQWRTPRDARGWGQSSGIESTAAPAILREIGLAFGLMHGRVLLHLSDISGDGLSAAHVGGGEGMRAEGKAYGGATLAATLVAAILRCEAMDREARDG